MSSSLPAIESCWQEAFKADALHIESVCNYAYYLWKNGRAIDHESLARVYSVERDEVSYWYLRALIEADMGFLERAKRSAEKAVALGYAYDRDRLKAILEVPGCTRVFEGHTYSVYSVAFSPDSRYVLSRSYETIRLWDIETGGCVRVFEGHAKRVNSVAFSPEGRYVLSGSWDNTMRLWELVWEWEFPQATDWDEGARPYLEIFLHLHPNWTEQDFQKLLLDLQLRGYGWLKPEGVRRELEKMDKRKKGKGG